MCKALAVAAPNIDSTKINRILFKNNGISDSSFASILNGMNQ
jgi:hypothetical protein